MSSQNENIRPDVMSEKFLSAVDPAELFLEQWRLRSFPDVDQFLLTLGPISPSELACVLQVDMCERWKTAERCVAETYLLRYPAVTADREAALDLIYWEYLVREQNEESANSHEFCKRFPQYAKELQDQIGLHTALDLESLALDAPRQSLNSATTFQDSNLQAANSLAGKTLGRYKIVSLLGKGGMGEVYLAVDTHLGREIALKVMSKNNQFRVSQERFQREARVMATLNHPHLCTVYDCGEIHGLTYLTMPRIVGETLSERIKRTAPLAVEEAVRIAAGIAQAVHVAHGAKIVHRDLKPANVMISNDGQPVVMDFGLAWRDDPDESELTFGGVITGTIAYLAPERIGAESTAPNPAGDIYSLGVILFEMLTGRLPFGGTAGQILRKVLNEPPPKPRELRPELEPRLETICLTALEKEPEARFTSMAEFAEALQSYRTPAVTGVYAKMTRQHQWRIVSLLMKSMLVMCVVFAMIWATWMPGKMSLVGILPQPGASDINRTPDSLRTGTEWNGSFQFEGTNSDNHGRMTLNVLERTGKEFRGIVVNQPGNFGWHVKGHVTGDQFWMEFGAPMAGYQSQKNRGVVHATLAADVLQGHYEDPSDRSIARISLTRNDHKSVP